MINNILHITTAIFVRIAAALVVAVALPVHAIADGDKDNLNIKGNVESYTENKYKFTYTPNGYTKGECLSHKTIYFDSDGNLTTTQGNDFTFAYNTSHQATTFVYQTTGRITINDRKHTFTIDRPNARFVCTYKQSIHRPTSAKYYPCRGCRRQEGRTAIFTYDKQGNVVKITNYISQIEVNGDYVSSSRDATYNPEANYMLRFEYTYDQHGNWTVMKCYDQSGMMVDWKEREYKYRGNSVNFFEEGKNE
jgi:hypothetical protein